MTPNPKKAFLSDLTSSQAPQFRDRADGHQKNLVPTLSRNATACCQPDPPLVINDGATG